MLTGPERAELYRHLNGYETNPVLIEAESIAHQVLPFIHRVIGQHTAHGINHSVEVIRYIDAMIDLMDPKLTQTEVELLYLAGWLHDIGNLRDRANHAAVSCDMIDRLNNKYLNLGRLKKPLKFVVQYHQSKYDLSEVPKRPYHIGRDSVRLPLLCAMFRLADACHMGEDRAFNVLFYLIQEDLEGESQAHWIANNAITAVDFDKGARSVIVYVSNKRAASILTGSFVKDFECIQPFIDGFLPLDKVEIKQEPRFKNH